MIHTIYPFVGDLFQVETCLKVYVVISGPGYNLLCVYPYFLGP